MDKALDRILAIDVGAGTQDVLLWEAGQPMENNIKLVMPSWTTILARQVKQATLESRPIFLTGNLMGGGPMVSAMKRHMRAGLPVFVTQRAALTIRDNPAQVMELGYTFVEEPPALPGLVTVTTRDVDLGALATALAPFGVTLPKAVAVAVQDHGECLEGSNRIFRFRLWREFVERGGEMISLAYRKPPSHYTRMLAVQQDVPDAVLMDTGPAAVWGILQDKLVVEHHEKGFIAVNLGNQHTLGVLVRNWRVLGLFEHHTVLMTPKKLQQMVDDLRDGTLTNESVFSDGGHGAYTSPEYSPGVGYDFVALTGPQRALAAGLDYYFAVPHGDMMLTGCFGLVAAMQQLLASG